MRSFFSSLRTEKSSRPTGRFLPCAKAEAMGAAAVKAKNRRRVRECSGIIGKANHITYHAEQIDSDESGRRSRHPAPGAGSSVLHPRSTENAGMVGRVRFLRDHGRLR